MLQILSLYFALRYCFTRDEKKKELIFSKLRWRSSKRSSSVSILTSFENELPLQHQKKHFNVIFSSSLNKCKIYHFVLPSGNLILLKFDSLSALDCPQAPRMTLPLPVGLVQARERLLILHHSPPRDWTESLNASFRRCLYRCSWRRCVAK